MFFSVTHRSMDEQRGPGISRQAMSLAAWGIVWTKVSDKHSSTRFYYYYRRRQYSNVVHSPPYQVVFHKVAVQRDLDQPREGPAADQLVVE